MWYVVSEHPDKGQVETPVSAAQARQLLIGTGLARDLDAANLLLANAIASQQGIDLGYGTLQPPDLD